MEVLAAFIPATKGSRRRLCKHQRTASIRNGGLNNCLSVLLTVTLEAETVNLYGNEKKLRTAFSLVTIDDYRSPLSRARSLHSR